MAMTTQSESFLKLLKLLQDEFELPKEATSFVLRASSDSLVAIEANYLPVDKNG